MNLYDELFEEPIRPELGICRISSTFSFMHSKVAPAFVLLISGILFYISPLDKRFMGFLLLYIVIGTTLRIRNMYDDVYIDYKRRNFMAKGKWRNRTIEKNFSELVKVKRPFIQGTFKLKFSDGTVIAFPKKWDTLEQLKVAEMIINKNN